MPLIVLLAAVAAQSANCSAETARPITIAELQSMGLDAVGQCVRFSGWQTGHYVYETRDDFYRHSPADDVPVREHAAVTGLYAPKNGDFGSKVRLSEDWLVDNRPVWVEVIGVVGNCQRDRESKDGAIKNGILMLDHSFCGWHNVNYVRAVELRFDFRKTIYRAAPNEELGEHTIKVAPYLPDDPGYETVVMLGQRLLLAYDAGDEAALQHLFDVQPEFVGTMRGNAPFLSDFKKWMRGSKDVASRQIAYFKAYATDIELDEPDPVDNSIICICKDDDCSGKWPIAAGDERQAPGRPYVCAQPILDRRNEDDDIDHRLIVFPGGLPEPPEPYFHAKTP